MTPHQKIVKELSRRGVRVLNRTDPVTFEDVRPGNAWYVSTNVHGNKIHHVYHKNTIDKIFQRVPNGQPAKGPTTRKPFDAQHVKKLTKPSAVYVRPASTVPAQSQFDRLVQQHIQEMQRILYTHFGHQWNHECDQAFKDLVVMNEDPSLYGGGVMVAGDSGVHVEVAMFLVGHRYHIYFADSDAQNEMYMYDVDDTHFETGLHRVFRAMTGTSAPYFLNYHHEIQNPSHGFPGNHLGQRIVHVTINQHGTVTRT